MRWESMLYMKPKKVVAQCSLCGHYMLNQHQLTAAFCTGECGVPLFRQNDDIFRKPIPDYGEVFDSTPLIRGEVVENASDIPTKPPWYVKLDHHYSSGTNINKPQPKAPRRFPVPDYAKRKYKYRTPAKYYYRSEQERAWHKDLYPQLGSPAKQISATGDFAPPPDTRTPPSRQLPSSSAPAG